MAATGVRVTRLDGDEKVYPSGRSFDFDGYGDYVIRDETGAAIATRRRAGVEAVEVLHDDVDTVPPA